jgi:hypothetical protein
MTTYQQLRERDFTPDNTQGRFNVIGGDAEIWYNSDTKKYNVVYFVPGQTPPLPVYWEIPDEQTLQAYFGPDVSPRSDRHVTSQQLLSYGALKGGLSTEIQQTDQNPLEGWASLYEQQSRVRPYLRDPEVVARIMAASLEGRAISKAELEDTQWWQTKTEGEREWLIMAEADPETAQQLLDSNRQRVILDLQNAGVNDPPDDLITVLTEKYTSGLYTENQLVAQISAVSDPYSNFEMDADIASVVSGVDVDTTRGEEDTVRDLLNKWLGPVYGNWTEKEIQDQAGALRNDPDARIAFEEQLKDQRVAMFPTFQDREQSYQAIAQPWANFWQQRWGVAADETDPLFQQMLTTNNAVENGAALTKEGLRRGISKVTNDVQSKIIRATGGSVAR